MPPRRRGRWWRYLLIAGTVFVCLLLAAPHSVALAVVRDRIAAAIADRTGATCRIGRLGFSWFTGLSLREFELGNPPGFPSDRPALRIGSASLDPALLGLLRGRLHVAGTMNGLEVFVDQTADGRTNLQALAGPAEDPSGAPGKQEPDGGGDSRRSLANLSCDLQLRDATIEIRQQGRLLEALTELQCTARKPFDSRQVTVDLDTKLRPMTSGGDAGRVQLKLQGDLDQGNLDAMLSTTGLDLQRYRPLIDTFLPGQLTALGGVVNGACSAKLLHDELVVDGELAVGEPRLAGPLVAGMDLRAPRWTLQPGLRWPGVSGQKPRDLDTRRFALDLGFAQLRGTDATAGRTKFTYGVDLDQLARFGGRMPAMLAGSAGRLDGTLELPADAEGTNVPALLASLLATAQLALPRLQFAGFELQDLRGTANLADGNVTVTSQPGAKLDGGPVSLSLQCDLRQLELAPTTLSLRWQDGQLHRGMAEPLRYLMPLFAGLGESALVQGRCDFDIRLSGPGRPQSGETWLQWLDHWSGTGNLGLRDTEFAPAPALAQLLAPMGPMSTPQNRLGEGGLLRIDALSAPFRFAAGAIQTQTAEWLTKGRKIGLSGSVHLDGRLDYGFDLSALLQGHRDGDRVLKALGGKLPPAQLSGTVIAPALGLPDLAAVLQQVAENELQQRGSELLQRSLEELLRRKKKQ